MTLNKFCYLFLSHGWKYARKTLGIEISNSSCRLSLREDETGTLQLSSHTTKERPLRELAFLEFREGLLILIWDNLEEWYLIYDRAKQ